MRCITRVVCELWSYSEARQSSPLVRAMQTAEILAEEYDAKPARVEWLRPEAPYEDFAQWARSRRDKETVVIVGHEPHLSGLVSWLLAGAKRSLLEMKKAGACLLEMEDAAGPSSATLVWSMGPKQLRAIGRK